MRVVEGTFEDTLNLCRCSSLLPLSVTVAAFCSVPVLEIILIQGSTCDTRWESCGSVHTHTNPSDLRASKRMFLGPGWELLSR
jgi:hypothetical protein